MRTSRLMQGPNALAVRALVAGLICAGTATAAMIAGGTVAQAAIYIGGIIALAGSFGLLEHRAVVAALDRGRRAAGRDALTELASGAVAEHFVAMEFAAAQRGRAVTIVVFGLDNFDRFAATEGAYAADRAVREFGLLLKRLTRRMNLSARYGWRADVFISVLSDANADGAEVFVQRVRTGLAECGAQMPMPTISAGIAEYDPCIGSPEGFVEAAEMALAEARADGGDCVRVLRPATPNHASELRLRVL